MVQASLSQVLRLDRLLQAWAKVKGNKGGPGGDGIAIPTFEEDALSRLVRLREDVLSGHYWPGPIRTVHIRKKSGGWRPLSIPCIPDRVLQTSVAQALTPGLEAEFEPASYGYRPGRSVAMAVSRVAHLRRQGFVWTVDADILKFFENVPHDPLLKQLERHVGDRQLVDLIALWLAHAESDGRGLPQGSPLSPLLANLYLDILDEALDSTRVRLVRFADDFVLLCKSEADAQKSLTRTVHVLTRLGLELNLEKTRIVDYGSSLNFLGRLFVRSLVMDDDLSEEVQSPGEVGRGQSGADRAELVDDSEDQAGNPDEGARRSRAHRLSPRIQTLYVYEAGSRLEADGAQYVVTKAGRDLARLPALKVQQIEVGPHADINAGAMRLAAANAAIVHLCDGWGHVAVTAGTGSTNRADIHLEQASLLQNEPARIEMARSIVSGRLANQRALLRRFNRNRKLDSVAAAATKIGITIRKLARADTPSALMGYEGEAAASFWPALSDCLEHGWTLPGRHRRPPPDPVNLVLSFLASRITSDVDLLVRKCGLHPGFGCLHSVSETERPTLALDLVEIFRAPLVEGLALYAFNNRILQTAHFTDHDEGVRFALDGAKRLVRAYEDWLDRPIRSPFSGQEVLWRGLIEEQVMEYRHAICAGRTMQTYRMDY